MSQKNGSGEEKKRLFCTKLKRKNGKIGADFNVPMYIYYRPIFYGKFFILRFFTTPYLYTFVLLFFIILYYSYL